MKKTILILLSAIMPILLCNCRGENNMNNGTNTSKSFDYTEGVVTKSPEWTAKAIIYQVNVWQYTESGTFAEFGEHLERLKSMGFNTLYFMPIHPNSTDGSYYCVSDYYKVNPLYGNDADFKALIVKAHDMGFHVLMDWVGNHTAWDNPWITEHPDWYKQDESGNIMRTEAWADVAQLNYDNSDMRKEMINAMSYWVKEFDIDGYRCDYAAGVPVDFWEEARMALDKIKPVYLIAEDQTIGSLVDKAFDSNYNSKLFEGLDGIVKGKNNVASIIDYINVEAKMAGNSFPMNFLDSHDCNYSYNTPLMHFGRKAVYAMTAMLYTIPGAPMTYTSGEILYPVMIASFRHEAVVWRESDYSDFLAKAAEIKLKYPALYNGAYGAEMNVLDAGNKNVLAFERSLGGNRITVMINFSDENSAVTSVPQLGKNASVICHGTGYEYSFESTPADMYLGLTEMNPWEYYIIVSEQ